MSKVRSRISFWPSGIVGELVWIIDLKGLTIIPLKSMVWMLVIGVRGSEAMKRANEIFDAMTLPKNVKHQPKLFLSLDKFYLGLQSRLVNRYNVVAT